MVARPSTKLLVDQSSPESEINLSLRSFVSFEITTNRIHVCSQGYNIYFMTVLTLVIANGCLRKPLFFLVEVRNMIYPAVPERILTPLFGENGSHTNNHSSIPFRVHINVITPPAQSGPSPSAPRPNTNSGLIASAPPRRAGEMPSGRTFS
jgi:hypothetical protein